MLRPKHKTSTIIIIIIRNHTWTLQIQPRSQPHVPFGVCTPEEEQVTGKQQMRQKPFSYTVLLTVAEDPSPYLHARKTPRRCGDLTIRSFFSTFLGCIFVTCNMYSPDDKFKAWLHAKAWLHSSGVLNRWVPGIPNIFQVAPLVRPCACMALFNPTKLGLSCVLMKKLHLGRWIWSHTRVSLLEHKFHEISLGYESTNCLVLGRHFLAHIWGKTFLLLGMRRVTACIFHGKEDGCLLAGAQDRKQCFLAQSQHLGE